MADDETFGSDVGAVFDAIASKRPEASPQPAPVAAKRSKKRRESKDPTAPPNDLPVGERALTEFYQRYRAGSENEQ
jgi:hypothetical protein